MTTHETIEQFITSLETNFDPNEEIDLGIENFQYVKLNLPDKPVPHDISCISWTEEDKNWDVLIVKRGSTQVSAVISTLKTFLPQHKDDLMVTPNEKGFYVLFSSSRTRKTFIVDQNEKYLYIQKHHKVIKHNQSFLLKDIWNKFVLKMEVFATKETDLKCTLKFASFMLLKKRMLTVPDLEIPPPYFYLNKFYQTSEDLLKANPDTKDLEFSLYKGIMILNADLPKKKQSTTATGTDSVPVPIKEDFYWIGMTRFTMDELLKRYALTEFQLKKFFIDQYGNGVLICEQTDILESFKK